MLSRTPLYLEIQKFVRDGIKAGRFSEGEKLPSEPELAKRFHTTRATVARAFHQLAFEGLVDRRVGSGTFVSRVEVADRVDTTAFESHEEHVLARGESLEYRVLSFALKSVDDEVAMHLGIEPGTAVYRLERLRLVSGRPLAVEVRFIPTDIGKSIRREWLDQSTIQDVLQSYLGLRIDTIENTVRASLSSARIAKTLGTPRTMPLLVRAHTMRDRARRPLLFGETFYPAHFSVRYTLRAP
jgi:GntR family transcriptional regulator